MSTGLLLIDNDALLLLAGANLLVEAISKTGFTIAQARWLRSLEFMLKKSARAFRKYPAAALSRALEACAKVSAVQVTPTKETMSAFEHVVGVDAGEALLYGVMAEHAGYFLVSNDRTAMRAVATDARLVRIRALAAGRTVCMEWLVREFIKSLGPETTEQRFMQVVETDKRLISILSPVWNGNPQDCLAAAESFLNGLRRDLGEDFLFDIEKSQTE